MEEINEAYQVLSNPEKRVDYDQEYDAIRNENVSGNSSYREVRKRPERTVKSVRPTKSIRDNVQGLMYQSMELYESKETCIYLNLNYKLKQITDKYFREWDRMTFKGDNSDMGLLGNPYVAAVDEIVDEFRAACAQIGFFEDETDEICDMIQQSNTVNQMHYTLVEFMGNFVAIAQGREEFRENSYNQFYDEMRDHWSDGGSGLAGSLASFGKNAFVNVINRREVEIQLKELCVNYRDSLKDALTDYANYHEATFVFMVNKVYENGKLTLYKDRKDITKQDIPTQLPENSEEKLKVLVDLLRQHPYWSGLYEVLLKNYGDPNGNLAIFASAYEIDLDPIKQKSLKYFINQSDVADPQYWNKFQKKVSYLSYSDDNMYLESCAKYAKDRLNKIWDYSPTTINAFVKEMNKFDISHKCHTEQERNKYIRNKIFAIYHINLKPKSKKELEETLSRLEELKEKYIIDFNEQYNSVKRELERIIREEEQAAIQKEIDSRTVEYVVNYNPKSKELSFEKMVLENVSSVESFNAVTGKIKKVCKSLSFDMTEEEWDGQLKEIERICKEANYPEPSYLKDLKQVYLDEDRIIRTFKGDEYPTRAAMEEAKKEAEIIVKLNDQNKASSVDRLRMYKQAGFKSKHGIRETEKLENQVIQGYKSRTQDLQKHQQSAAMAVPVKIIEMICTVAIYASLAIGIIGFFIMGPLSLVMLIPLCIACAIKEKMSEHIVYSKPESYSGISVVNNQIVWKDTCTKCWTKLEANSSICPKCGNPIKQRAAISAPVASASASKSLQSKGKSEDSSLHQNEKSKIMICPQCGKQINKAAKFCVFCGKENPYYTKENAEMSEVEKYIVEHYTLKSKVDAMQYYKQKTGVSLKEAKDVVDQLLTH